LPQVGPGDNVYRIDGAWNASECVLLLHGLARTGKSMKQMEHALALAGYATCVLSYPSRKKALQSLVAQNFSPALQECVRVGFKKIHCVTHSMGGIIVRMGLVEYRPDNFGRVVMLSPPNQGSIVAEKLKSWWLFKLVNGRAGQQLGISKDAVPARLGAVDYEVGVITGNRHAFFDCWFSSFFSGENDGKVAVAEARVDGMADFLVVPEAHPFIMNSPMVARQTIHFLQQGHFSPRGRLPAQ